MRIGDLTRLSWDQVRRRKVVTALCAAGLSIGCAAIILALSIGESAQQYIENEMNSFFKMDEITVTANEGVPASGGQGGQAVGGDSAEGDDSLERGKLTDQKLAIMRNIKHVTAVAPFQQMNYLEMSTTDNRKAYVEVIGTDLNMLEGFDKPFMQGGPSDLIGTVVLNYGATLGLVDPETRDKLIEQLNRNPYDSSLMEQYDKMNRTPSSLFQRQVQFLGFSNDGKAKQSSPLRVTGVLKKPKGVSENAVAYDKKAYVSLETAQMLKQELNMGGGNAGEASYNSVIVKVDSQENVEQVEQQIKKLTLNTQTNLQQKERIAEQFGIIKAVALGGGVFILIIASISIVVAMTMSTYQRRRQIGIMKVLGANLAQIRNMFIIEAALLGLLGGLLGILFSYWIVWGINALIQSMPGSDQDAVIIFVPLMAIPVGMAFAILTGVISGIYPAVSASRTDALTAIRRD
ncbi:ABC transporter permease [Paenibacillus spongiae]|uniref:ABC transporter permease n=1 Tax=Paenibacillus spongiae TaxID=2909671 RepID=A0ABY5S9Z4_9BACL|nr:FtsX-like permease family protein [Paenibacillus spongiae]UVI30479.1 ABC transporter permease [Paenibacillus spongiae]